MKKVSTAAEAGHIELEQRVRTNAKALREVFGSMRRSRIVLETGTHSPWISPCSASWDTR
jgi:transposase